MEKMEPYKGIAEIYEEIRPSYPDRLIQDVAEKISLKPGDRLLEIGAGTGKATVQFADKGFQIRAIELGEDMAKILKMKAVHYPAVSVDVASFEQWSCPEQEPYDMIYSAQAFHWIDKAIKYTKCHGLLKAHGFLVLFWYSPCSNKSPETAEMEEKINRVIGKYADSSPSNPEKPDRLEHDGTSSADERITEIEASGLFQLVDKLEYTEEIRNTPHQYLKAMKSVPAFAALLDRLEGTVIDRMDQEIVDIINSYGGFVSDSFTFSLYLCVKI